MSYEIRKCRGHWHVTNWDHDLAIEGDPFATEAEAQAMADRMNAGYEPESLLSLMMRGAYSPFGPSATTIPQPAVIPARPTDNFVFNQETRPSWWQRVVRKLRRRHASEGK